MRKHWKKCKVRELLKNRPVLIKSAYHESQGKNQELLQSGDQGDTTIKGNVKS